VILTVKIYEVLSRAHYIH